MYFENNIVLHYCLIFRAIQALLQQPEINNNIVLKGILKKNDKSKRVFGEPYEGNWGLETKKTLPLLNYLLLIIFYSDATIFDSLGKTLEYPIFLTLRNLPNWVQNSPNSKTKGFGKILWDLNLNEIKPKVTLLNKSKNLSHPKLVKGLLQINFTLNIFLNILLQNSESDNSSIIIYEAVYLDNGEILQTSGDFQDKEWFSNILVSPAKDQDESIAGL
ncbi:21259_t:CDS:2, partial [Dentiscutata erythropus]